MRRSIGHPWIHRLEQWDLDCVPLICVHWRSPNRCQRVFCLWRWGIQIGKCSLSTRALRIGRRVHPWNRAE